MDKEQNQEKNPYDKNKLPLQFNKLPKISANVCKTFAKGFGGIFPLAAGLIVGKFLQKKIIYIPAMKFFPKDMDKMPYGYRSPSDRHMKYQDLYIKNGNVRIHGWFINSDKNDKDKLPTVMMFHGNAGNIGGRLDIIEAYQNKVKANFILMSYRGYGKSDGQPSQQKIQEDCHKIMDYLKSEEFQNQQPQFDYNQLFIHGRSIGGAVGIYIASNFKIIGLIIENTFTSLTLIADPIIPLVQKFQKHILSEKWENINRIDKITCPILFVSGEADELVPPYMMKELFEKAKQAKFKKFFNIPKGTHNEAWEVDKSKYFHVIKNFILKTLQK